MTREDLTRMELEAAELYRQGNFSAAEGIIEFVSRARQRLSVGLPAVPDWEPTV